MKTSGIGIKLIKKYEGCELEAYLCPAKVWTIGYGHTGKVDGKKICKGMRITNRKACELLANDLEKYEKKVSKYNKRYHWTPWEFDALVSFAFNIGSIDQLTALGTRSRNIIAKKIPLYNKSRGKVLDGLTRRRKEEQALFILK